MARPRAVEADAAILQAARELLGESGYEALTMAGVAARAGVAKSTLYRRWHGKAEVVFAAALHPPELEPPDLGSLAADLAAVAAHIAGDLGQPAVAGALLGLMGEMAASPRLAGDLRGRFVAAERRLFATVLGRAAERGEVAPATDPDLALEVLLGRLLVRACFTGLPVTAAEGARTAVVLARGLTEEGR